MSDLLQEYCDSRGLALRIDRQAGLIRGIKILGPRSRNGRDYLPEALSHAVGLYEGAKVNVNHPKGHPLAPRDYQERIGVIRNIQHRPGDGLFADFHFNPKHYLSEQLMWDAEHAPENVGFSHNVRAQTRRQGNNTLVEKILEVHGVDLVADPATTRGLFEEFPATETSNCAATNCVAAQTDAPAPPSINTNHDIANANHAVLPEVLSEQHSDPEKHYEEQTAEITRLRLQIDQLQAQAAVAQRQAFVQSLLVEYHLPNSDSTDTNAKAIVSDAFLQSLLAAPDEQTARSLVEQRSRLMTTAQHWQNNLRSQQPIARDQLLGDRQRVFDAKSFARAITV